MSDIPSRERKVAQSSFGLFETTSDADNADDTELFRLWFTEPTDLYEE